MKIEGTGRIGGDTKTGKVKKTAQSSSVFSTGSTEGTSEVSDIFSLSGPSEVLGAQALLNLQESLHLSPQDKQQVRNANKILDDLSQIQKSFLTGTYSKSTLQDLVMRLNDQRESATNADLDALLNQIELRAEVELAKLSYNQQKSLSVVE